jgi:putative oxidoreductase
MNVGLLVLRLALGATMAAHGAQKLWGWFGGPGLSGTAKGFESLGFVPGRRAALFAGLAEVGGGSLLALGLLTPAAAAVFLALMLVAAVSVHLPNGFFTQNGGFEYNLVLAAGALSVAFTGPGALSVDGVMGLPLSGAGWGIAALLAGLVGGAAQLATRRQPVTG